MLRYSLSDHCGVALKVLQPSATQRGYACVPWTWSRTLDLVCVPWTWSRTLDLAAYPGLGRVPWTWPRTLDLVPRPGAGAPWLGSLWNLQGPLGAQGAHRPPVSPL